MINLHNQDCMIALKNMKENQYDLAIVDPPYGIDFAKTYTNRTKKDRLGQRHTSKDWDSNIPSDEFFDLLFKVSKNQIIWGGNYFPSIWQRGGKGIIFWFKGNPVSNFSDGELAWTSFDKVARQFDYRYYGNLQGSKMAALKIHPTQKPVELYEWLLMNYAEPGNTILDTHLGSGSIAIACHNLGFSLDGYEVDEDYYLKAKKRLDQHTAQIQLWT